MQFVGQQNPANMPVDAFAEQQMVSPFLHYAVFRDPFRRMVFLDPLTSWESLIHERYYDPLWAFYVPPGSLPYYDFEDLRALLPEGSCKLVNPVVSTGYKEKMDYDAKEILTFLEKGVSGE